MKRYGADWKNDGDTWVATVNGRFHAKTWRFGEIYQCVVDVAYQHAKAGAEEARITLPPQETRDAAMRRAVLWIEEYAAASTPGPEEVFAAAFRDYPSLFRTRLDVIDHLFFVVGNGFVWLDGVVMNSDQSNAEEREAEHARWIERDARIQKTVDEALKLHAKVDELLGTKTPIPLTPGYGTDMPRPFPDDGKPHHFYPLSETYSMVCNVPPDVRHDWLRAAYEAALTLRDRSGGEHGEVNARFGAAIVVELEARFRSSVW